ncbi:class I SAM-dependent methyltransferase [Bacteroidia bacterium]|nr:class I SAM-dependent methyltransferase [Bacteroidia bacterium]MDB9882526.1 class I SAM-dependent methyltransferase [Bacteroidia bacterium]MDC1395320.1 class I SAM-dependent methyltransferase [Bacteroidia bacterium]
MISISKKLKNIDIYLLDQILKGSIQKGMFILDAGCGNGRNSEFLLDEGYNVYGMEPEEDSLQELWSLYPTHKQQFVHSTLEDSPSFRKFNFIICNAVLHFADTHTNF